MRLMRCDRCKADLAAGDEAYGLSTELTKQHYGTDFYVLKHMKGQMDLCRRCVEALDVACVPPDALCPPIVFAENEHGADVTWRCGFGVLAYYPYDRAPDGIAAVHAKAGELHGSWCSARPCVLIEMDTNNAGRTARWSCGYSARVFYTGMSRDPQLEENKKLVGMHEEHCRWKQ